ncbi:MAG: MBG domain-containing protein, partial [Bacteroidota bacterium]
GFSAIISSSDESVLKVSSGTIEIMGAGSATLTASVPGTSLSAIQSVTVAKAVLTVTAENKSRDYGEVNPALTYNYSGFKNSESASVIDTAPTATTTATVTSNVGTYPITASGGTDNNYTFSYTAGTLTVTKATPTATADNKSRVYGDANPSLTLTYTGFKNNESASVIDTAPTATTTATVTSNVGTYPITASCGTDNNYTFSYAAGTLTVTKATLTATPDKKSRGYGDANPVFTITYSGFKNNETATMLDTPPTGSTTAVTGSSVGAYPISLAGGTDNNYGFTFGSGTLTITKATITATAENKSRVYGDANPVFTISYAGFKNNETSSVIDSPPVASSTATVTSNAGSY